LLCAADVWRAAITNHCVADNILSILQHLLWWMSGLKPGSSGVYSNSQDHCNNQNPYLQMPERIATAWNK
jgi:hypothetical protein